MATADINTSWTVKVRRYLGLGYGVEDIAVKLKCDASAVRREVQIYRQEGRLRKILRLKVKA